MLKLREEIKIYISAHKTDMRKSIDGLTALVVDNFEMNPMVGNVFVFFNKPKNKVKLLFWDINGFVMYYKRIEKGKFHIKERDEHLEITGSQLNWLLAGLDFSLMNEFSEIDFNNFY